MAILKLRKHQCGAWSLLGLKHDHRQVLRDQCFQRACTQAAIQMVKPSWPQVMTQKYKCARGGKDGLSLAKRRHHIDVQVPRMTSSGSMHMHEVLPCLQTGEQSSDCMREACVASWAWRQLCACSMRWPHGLHELGAEHAQMLEHCSDKNPEQA